MWHGCLRRWLWGNDQWEQPGALRAACWPDHWVVSDGSCQILLHVLVNLLHLCCTFLDLIDNSIPFYATSHIHTLIHRNSHRGKFREFRDLAKDTETGSNHSMTSDTADLSYTSLYHKYIQFFCLHYVNYISLDRHGCKLWLDSITRLLSLSSCPSIDSAHFSFHVLLSIPPSAIHPIFIPFIICPSSHPSTHFYLYITSSFQTFIGSWECSCRSVYEWVIFNQHKLICA